MLILTSVSRISDLASIYLCTVFIHLSRTQHLSVQIALTPGVYLRPGL